MTVQNDLIEFHRGSIPIFVDNSIDFKGTGSKFCSIGHFYMLMNNSGIGNIQENIYKENVVYAGTQNQVEWVKEKLIEKGIDEKEIEINVLVPLKAGR